MIAGVPQRSRSIRRKEISSGLRANKNFAWPVNDRLDIEPDEKTDFETLLPEIGRHLATCEDLWSGTERVLPDESFVAF